MFDLRAPGVTVRPIGRLDGRPAFAEVFLDEVFVPDEDVIGEPGGAGGSPCRRRATSGG